MTQAANEDELTRPQDINLEGPIVRQSDDRNKTTHDYLWGDPCELCGSEAGEVCRPGCKFEPCPGCGYPWRDGGCECSFEEEPSDDDELPYDSDRHSYGDCYSGDGGDRGWGDDR